MQAHKPKNNEEFVFNLTKHLQIYSKILQHLAVINFLINHTNLAQFYFLMD